MEGDKTYPLLLNIPWCNYHEIIHKPHRDQEFRRVCCLKDRWKAWVMIGLREIRELKASPSGNKQKEVQLGLHIHGFHILGFNQPWIKNIWRKKILANSKRSKTWIRHMLATINVALLLYVQLCPQHLPCIRYYK